MGKAFDGLLVLEKPAGITSRDALDQAARWFPRRTRIGHTGTLDPLATGVLVLCLDGATRLVEYVQRMPKTYTSVFRLGATSDSDDADGRKTPRPDASDPGRAAVEIALAQFVGTIEQTPPAYSAARVAGRRAYAMARKGEEVSLAPRPVQIHRIDVVRYAYPEVEVEVHCGKGTYIRSLARDLGEQLGIGAYVETLRRTRVGPFADADAVPLDAGRDEARGRLLPIALAASALPRLVLSEPELMRLRRGQSLGLPALARDLNGEVAVFAASGELAAISEVQRDACVLKPVKVLG